MGHDERFTVKLALEAVRRHADALLDYMREEDEDGRHPETTAKSLAALEALLPEFQTVGRLAHDAILSPDIPTRQDVAARARRDHLRGFSFSASLGLYRTPEIQEWLDNAADAVAEHVDLNLIPVTDPTKMVDIGAPSRDRLMLERVLVMVKNIESEVDAALAGAQPLDTNDPRR